MRNCNASAQALREHLLNIVEHYKNNHESCFFTCRCKTDPNYRPSKVIIQSKQAENLLLDAIKNTPVFQCAEDFVFCNIFNISVHVHPTCTETELYIQTMSFFLQSTVHSNHFNKCRMSQYNETMPTPLWRHNQL